MGLGIAYRAFPAQKCHKPMKGAADPMKRGVASSGWRRPARTGEQATAILAGFATVVPDNARTELDAC
jgi:hypothetical protein